MENFFLKYIEMYKTSYWISKRGECKVKYYMMLPDNIRKRTMISIHKVKDSMKFKKKKDQKNS